MFTTKKLFVVFFTLIISGCSVFLPKHPNSNYRTDDTTELELIDCKDIKNKYLDKYSLAFPDQSVLECTPTMGVASLPGTVALMAVNFAFGEIQKRLKEEAKLYTAQYSDRTFTTEFFNKNNSLHYFGIKLSRKVKNEPASEIIFGLAPVGIDSPFFIIKPISVKIYKAKAKVLNDAIWTWLPPFIVSKIFAEDSHSVDLEIQLKLNFDWIEKDEIKSRNSSYIYNLPGYDIDKLPTLCIKQDDKKGCDGKLPSQQPSVIVALPKGTKQLATIEILVTEKDSWNTPEKLSWVEKQVESAKGKADDFIKEKDK